ncbi:sigma-70 family RNA polymerase sigma factor [Streptomyces virginiae]|uniref:sigma-70 family RNA polymerase sigma factor n=1 Tax=Streptomyces virginiae TaxID=1961 RepID=UPI0035DD9C8E
MTDTEDDPFGEQAVEVELAGAMPVDFVAFHSQNGLAFLHYAQWELGDPEVAAAVVEDVFTFLLQVWPEALQEASLSGFAWAHLREHVARYKAAEVVPVALVKTAQFAALRRASRRQLKAQPVSTLGLYEAIAELPERQHDVVLLTFVLDLERKKVAQLMGISTTTVRSHIHTARRMLAEKIDLDWTPGEGKDL